MKKIVLATVLAVVSSGVMARDMTEIKFGVDPTFAPFESKAPDGSLVGFDIDLGNAICAQLKAKCVWVETSFDSIIPALRAKKFDGIMSALSINEKRKAQIDFSDRLYNSPTKLIVKKGSDLDATVESLKGKHVGVTQGTTQEAYMKSAWAPGGVVIKSYQTQDLVYQDLMSGRLDATLTDAPVADIGFIQTPKGAGYTFSKTEVKDEKILGEGIAIGLRKGDDELETAVNGALKALHENGTYKQLADKYFSFDIYN
ncbi:MULTISPECIES: ABC transporter substrate-binding protein [Pseudomonas]|uniref:ABC transporter substrate-binding protein n=1 Tax=Pseudomonas izuensis TaxID=2684212 RepID=A0ABM7RWW5_9PSED|nr:MULTISPECIES: ABC transporter substrate-binding protein [Pseudomonas]RKS24915.1 amino acid ABC transporter substrate-binding protein (PAAT family) [Pseudomonas sp. WPR_5_2]BCX68997.1 ABC transporter substrate-binding protein [Pseudomonas izuensis]